MTRRGPRGGGGRRGGLVLRLGLGLGAGWVALVALGSPAASASAVAAYAAANQPIVNFSSASPSGISGTVSFTPDLGYGGGVSSVSVTVSFKGQTVSSCGQCLSGAGFGFTPTGLVRNGPYSVTATATADESLLGTGLNHQTRVTSASTGFSVAAPPAAPHVSTVVNSDGSVTVNWSHNTEPDLLGYQVKRSSGSGFVTVLPKAPPTQVSLTDTTTAQGGTFSYIVYALRPGPDGSATSAVSSSSNTASVSVPVPTPASTTSVPGGAVTSDSTTTTVAAPPATAGQSGSSAPDLSAFLAQANKAGTVTHAASGGVASAPAPHVVLPGAPQGPPDTYQPTLPFVRGGQPNSTAGAPRIALPSPSPVAHHRGLLYSIAGGLLLCVLGLAVRNANKGSAVPALEPAARRRVPRRLRTRRAPRAAPPAAPVETAATDSAAVPASVAAKAMARAAARTAATASPAGEAAVERAGEALNPPAAPRPTGKGRPAAARRSEILEQLVPAARAVLAARSAGRGSATNVAPAGVGATADEAAAEGTAGSVGAEETSQAALPLGLADVEEPGVAVAAAGDTASEVETVITEAIRATSGAIPGGKTFTEPPAEPVPDGLSHLPPLVAPGRKSVRAPEWVAGGEDTDFFGLVRGVQEPEVPTPAG